MTALLTAERKRSDPDATTVEELLSKRARVITVQRSLRADDSDGIQKAIADSVDMLRTLPDRAGANPTAPARHTPISRLAADHGPTPSHCSTPPCASTSTGSSS